MPEDYRRQNHFAKVPAIIGINAHDGAAIASKRISGLIIQHLEWVIEIGSFMVKKLAYLHITDH